MKRTIVLITVLVAVNLTSAESEQISRNLQTLVPQGLVYDEFLGMGGAIDGDTAAVTSAVEAESVYVFTRRPNGWTQQARLGGDATFEEFGPTVALDGDTLLVGAPGDDDNGVDAGAVHVFERSGNVWKQEAKLLAADGDAGDRFGDSLDIKGDTVVIGAWFDEHNGFGSGSAYVFVREGGQWTQQAKLLSGDGAREDRFGRSVAVVDGETVLVGAPWSAEYPSLFWGKAYVFSRSTDGWTLQAALRANDTNAGDQFASAIAADGDTAVIGAPGKEPVSFFRPRGAAYVFTRKGGSWTQHARVDCSSVPVFESAWCGRDVDLQGDTMAVTSLQPVGGPSCPGPIPCFRGWVSIFTRADDVWTIDENISPTPFGNEPDGFAYFVSVYGKTMLTGDPNNGYGAAYIFSAFDPNP